MTFDIFYEKIIIKGYKICTFLIQIKKNNIFLTFMIYTFLYTTNII